jgi:membrane-bound inhibitor of C-type lysozyme
MKTNRVLTYLGILLPFLLITLTTCSPLKARTPWEKVYECDEGKLLLVEVNQRDESVMLTISGKWYYLPKVPSASGAKYSDGNNTFWSKGESAIIELDNKITYQNCRPKP